MKNFSLILNVLLLAAVGHLYYLNLSKPAPVEEKIEIEPVKAATEKPIKMAYVDIDTLEAQYEWFKEQKSKLEKQLKNSQRNFERRQKKFYERVEAFQIKIQEGNTPRKQLEDEQAALAKEEQAIAKEGERLARSLEKESMDTNQKLQQSLEDKLTLLRDQIGYDYVLGYQKGLPSTMLLTNEALDISTQVLELLNAQEEEEKK